MNNLIELIKQITFQELAEKRFGATEQFLNVHSIEKENGDFKIANIILNEDNASVFLNVENEDFYFVIYLDLKPKIEITGTRSEPKYEISVQFASESLSENELKSYTKLIPARSWNIGDARKSGKTFNKFSSLIFELNPEADFFENKLENTLDFLEKDSVGITKLAENADANFSIFTTYHNGNTLLDEIFISKENLKRITDLKLSLSFKGFASGNFYKD